MSEQTPRSLGYAMPAEWAKHEATWISWPKNPLTFPADIIASIEDTYCQMVKALTEGEIVKILVNDEAAEKRVLEKVEKAGAVMRRVKVMRIVSSDVWIRDYGPTFLLNKMSGQRAAVKWHFNAWGGKYDDLLYDDKTGDEVVKTTGGPIFRPDLVLEGGSIEVNGVGTVLTTEQCLLNKNRNPKLTKLQIEDRVNQFLGTNNMIWLKSGIDGDDTDGHVDDFARFVSPNHVLFSFTTYKKGTNEEILRKNLDILKSARDQAGRKLEVEKLPMPKPVWMEEEKRWLPASYANFYIGNNVVLLPVFNDSHDKEAISIMRSAFPKKLIVPMNAVNLVYGYGGIHCITQQEPAPGVPVIPAVTTTAQ
jgi:agmatine deiminase